MYICDCMNQYTHVCTYCKYVRTYMHKSTFNTDSTYIYIHMYVLTYVCVRTCRDIILPLGIINNQRVFCEGDIWKQRMS